jgi:ferredoxin
MASSMGSLATVRVTVDSGSCHGHQMCAIAAPEVFGSDDLGYATVLLDGDIPAELEKKVQRAEANCPERAIRIVD